MEALELELKKSIIEQLGFEDIEAETIESDAPLFGEGLGLDSIDALELVIQVEKRFGVKIKSSEETRVALTSVAVLADYILARAPEKVAAEFEKAGN